MHGRAEALSLFLSSLHIHGAKKSFGAVWARTMQKVPLLFMGLVSQADIREKKENGTQKTEARSKTEYSLPHIFLSLSLSLSLSLFLLCAFMVGKRTVVIRNPGRTVGRRYLSPCFCIWQRVPPWEIERAERWECETMDSTSFSMAHFWPQRDEWIEFIVSAKSHLRSRVVFFRLLRSEERKYFHPIVWRLVKLFLPQPMFDTASREECEKCPWLTSVGTLNICLVRALCRSQFVILSIEYFLLPSQSSFHSGLHPYACIECRHIRTWVRVPRSSFICHSPTRGFEWQKLCLFLPSLHCMYDVSHAKYIAVGSCLTKCNRTKFSTAAAAAKSEEMWCGERYDKKIKKPCARRI